MATDYLIDDEIVRDMTRALRETDLNSAASRAAAYEKAGIPSEQIVAFDARATAVERARRAYGIGEISNPAALADSEEDWRL
jgi:hypothetical protein